MGWDGLLGWVLTRRSGVWGWSDGVLSGSDWGWGGRWGGGERGNTIFENACENTGVQARQLRGPLFFHTWTVVDRKSRFRGPLFFHAWTVVDRSFLRN